MARKSRFFGWWCVALLTVVGISPSYATLPGLGEKEWIGHFLGYDGRKIRFGLESKGRAKLQILKKDGAPLGQRLAVVIDFLIEEVQPDGSAVPRALVPDSLESTSPATKELKNISFRGKVKGDATFEVVINEERGAIVLGGRVLTPGTLKGPLRFAIRAKVPAAYPSAKKAGDRKIERAFEDKIKNDRLTVEVLDGKRVRRETGEILSPEDRLPERTLLSAVRAEFGSYGGRKLGFTASEHSTMELSESQVKPLHQGFTVHWRPDPANDPQGKARMTIEVK